MKAFDPSASVVTTAYVVPTSGAQYFIPGNNQAYSNSHDNSDNGTMTERLDCCKILSPNSEELVAS